MRRRMRLMVAALGIAAALVALGAGCLTRTARQAPGPGTGKDAPDFTLQDLNGQEVTLSSFQGKKAVMIDFWATWCPPCKKTLPHVEAIHQQHRDQVEVLAISLDDSQDDVRRFVQEKGYSFRVLWLDTTRPDHQKIASDYKVEGIPHLLFIDKDGKIRSDVQGQHSEKQLLAELKTVGVGG